MPPGSTENDGDGGRGGVDNPDDQSDTRICKFYLRGGKCYENDLCGYLHTKNVPNDIIYAISDAKYICKFFITKRGCKYAEQCRDKHIPFDDVEMYETLHDVYQETKNMKEKQKIVEVYDNWLKKYKRQLGKKH
eukprot:UN24909